ncbi:MAG: DUF1631 domain-containing protein, partial [Gammaproteobacteria bacterium]|nr:DUF1631 domain-containing protein [Gammaproteobacteria bacterium]
RYLDAMRGVRKQRTVIETGFLDGAMARYDEFWRGTERRTWQQTAQESGELSLIGEAELEEALAINAMVSKGESRFERSLAALKQRFTRLSGRQEMGDDENPVGPAVLADCFRKPISELEVELAVKLVILKLFDRQVISNLGPLYDEINARFEKAGILANLNLRVRRPVGAPVAPTAGAPLPLADAYGMDAGPEGAELFNLLASLVRSQRASTAYSQVSMPVVPTPDLLGALSSLQQSAVATGPSIADLASIRNAQAALRDTLLKSLNVAGPAASRALGGVDEDVIDMVSMLFDFILEDRNLPDAMKALLSRLQIPMIKLALVDRGFFSRKTHPARRLLNNLARAGTGWVDDGDRTPKSLFGRVETAVNRVLTEFETDPSVFEAVNDDFGRYLETELRGAEVAEERIRQVSRGQEQLKIARNKVTDVIEKRIWARPDMPDVVKEILRAGWKDVMLLALLREGEESPSWKKAVEVVERLIWSVTPKAQPLDRQELLSAIPPLLSELKEGFSMISFDARRTAELMKDLQTHHIACLRGTVPTPVPAAPGAAPRAAQPEAAVAPVGPETRPAPTIIDDEFQAKAQALQVGQWVEWDGDGDQPVRAKLSWRSEVTGTYIFVNRKGMKVAEMSVADVAQLLRTGRASVLAAGESPLMERALAAMVSALEQSKKGAAPAESPA